jgi:hypothetical protein
VEVHNELDQFEENTPMATQDPKVHSEEFIRINHVDDDIIRMPTNNQTDIYQSDEDAPLAVQENVVKPKNKRGNTKKWRRKMPLTSRYIAKRKQDQQKKFYQKHKNE